MYCISVCCVCLSVCDQAMWLMLQQETAQDFVIATGVAHSVREFVIAAFQHVGVDIVYVSIFVSLSLSVFLCQCRSESRREMQRRPFPQKSPLWFTCIALICVA